MENKNTIPEMHFIDRMSALLDSKFQLPGTKFKFGLDPIVGLIPVLGDLFSMSISMYLLSIVAKRGGSRKLIILMVLNIFIDTIIGSIPILGNIFDFAFKANNRNIQLMRDHFINGKHQGSGSGIIFLIILFMISVLFLVGYIIYKSIIWIISLF